MVVSGRENGFQRVVVLRLCSRGCRLCFIWFEIRGWLGDGLQTVDTMALHNVFAEVNNIYRLPVSVLMFASHIGLRPLLIHDIDSLHNVRDQRRLPLHWLSGL